MEFSDNAMSAILLCSYIGIKSDDVLRPLSLGEWNNLLEKLKEDDKEPEIVLHNELNQLKTMRFSNQYIDRIQGLVSRGGSIAFELDDLFQKGIKVVTIFDEDYPVLIKRKLKKKIPPVLFYAGDIKLAKKIGIAVVGSRNVDQDGIDFTKKLVEKASKEKLIIYSGGAKGVDSISEKTAISTGGAVVSFLADSLLSRIKKKEILDSIMQGKMLLLSDVKPDLGFNAARAMNRNKYIYASAYGAFVIASDYNKGGTWTGALEAIRNQWTKTLVWNHKEYSGNQKLIEKGGIAYQLSDEKIYDVITKKEVTYEQMNIFSKALMPIVEEKKEHAYSSEIDSVTEDIYHYVKYYIAEHIGEGMDVNDASRNFNVTKGQMAVWLKRLCADNLLECKQGIYSKM